MLDGTRISVQAGPFLVRIWLFLLVAFLPVACGDRAEDGAAASDRFATPGDTSNASSHAIHIYVGKGVNKRRLDLAPVQELSTPGAQPMSFPGSGTETVDNAEGADVWRTALTLLYGAAVECGSMPLALPIGDQTPTGTYIPPWKVVDAGPMGAARAWFVFPPIGPEAPAANPRCLGVIRLEQTILCMADKLAEVADAVEPIRWELVHMPPYYDPDNPQEYGQFAGSPTENVPPPSPWLIPVQADEDRFIIRDLAIYTLAHLPMMDAMPLPLSDDKYWYYEYGQTCSEIWAETAATNENWELRSKDILFGVWEAQGYPGALFAPLVYWGEEERPIGKVDPNTGEYLEHYAGAIAYEALQIQAQTMRAGARLLHDLIRRSIYSDLASAERRSAMALDPSRANKVFWGEEGAYGSLAHAVRILAGRWETGSARPDPTCQGIAALDVIQRYGADRTARIEDLPISTELQSLASQIMERAGILIPPCSLKALPEQTLRSAIHTELVTQAQDASGIADGNGFFDGVHALGLRRMLDDIAVQDLRFALERNWFTYRMLRNLGNSPVPYSKLCQAPQLDAVGLSQTRVTTEVGNGTVPLSHPDVKGAAVEGGLSRSRLPGDWTAHAAAIMGASQCDAVHEYWQASGADPVDWNLDPDVFPSAAGAVAVNHGKPWKVTSPRWQFQDAFQIGNALMQRLRMLSLRTAGLPSMSGDEASAPEVVARSAAAEVRTWAGPGRLVAWTHGPYWSPQVRTVVDLFGFAAEDFGVQRIEDIPRQLKIVHGPPWIAQCAARMRSDCPEWIESVVAIEGDPMEFSLPATAPEARPFGVMNSFVRVAFENLPERDEDRSTAYYLIANHDPHKPGQGMILGTLQIEKEAGSFSSSVTVSKLQRELFHMVVGLGQWVGERPPALGEGSAGKSPAYCVDGISRNQLVVLENELTSDGDDMEDSWRHYLNLAKQAAGRADQLGTELVGTGLVRDQRAEAAAEALSQICGDPSTLERVEVGEDGTVSPSPADATLEQCLREPTYEVVLFSSKPDDWGQNPLAQLEALKEMLNCDEEPERRDPWCSSDLANGNSVGDLGTALDDVVGFLDIVDPPDVSVSPTSCADIGTIAKSLRTGLDAADMNRILGGRWASIDRMRSTALGMKLMVTGAGSWELRAHGVVLMSSESDTVWPGCLRSPTHCQQDPALLEALNEAYRWSDVAGNSCQTQALGECQLTAFGLPEEAELNSILWRVKGSLWTLGAMLGEVHAGMFQLPIPIANQQLITNPLNVTMVPPGVFLPSGQGYQLDGSILEAQSLDLVYPIDGRFQARTAAQESEVPQWLHRIYALDANRYYHAFASNSEEKWAAGCPSTGPCPLTVSGIGGLLDNLSGLKCDRPYGDASNPGADSLFGEKHLKALSFKTLLGTYSVHRQDASGSPLHPAGSFRDLFQPPRVYLEWYNPEVYEGTVAAHYVVAPRIEGLPYVDNPPAFGANGNNGYGEGRSTLALPLADRVRAFANSGPANGRCGVAAELIQAILVGCVGSNSSTAVGLSAVSPNPPPLTTLDDLAALERWLERLSQASESQMHRLYLRRIPKRVVADLKEGVVGSGSTKGLRGERLLEMESAIQALGSNWGKIGGHLASASAAITSTRGRIKRSEIENNIQLVDLAIRELRAYASLAQGAATMLSAWDARKWVGADGVATLASGGITMGAAAAELDALGDLEGLYDDAGAQDVFNALQDLRTGTATTWSDLNTSLGTIRSSTADIMRISSALANLQNQAAYEAAKGSGADFVKVDGREVNIPVNTVLRRQYDATRIRYDRALRDAKALAYVGRRAIEQRIGTPMNSISVRVGALDAPSQWADDVCGLSGIDYEALRERSPNEDADTQAVEDFADAFVGDYVAKLESFVEYFNLQYPAHEADDTAVVSIRRDLAPQTLQCVLESPNLLHFSGGLDVVFPAGAGAIGWGIHDCSGMPTCLRVMPGAALAHPKQGPEGMSVSDVTWLVDELVGGSNEVDSSAMLDGPAGYVSQSVFLKPGNYVLSWWDQARGPVGALPAATDAQKYRITVFDEDWSAFVTTSEHPGGDGVGGWSPRRAMSFSVSTAANYHIAFAASLGGGYPGSVAIAAVQLEVAQPDGLPTTYDSTGASRSTPGLACPLSAEEFRSSFEYRCDAPNVCYYAFTRPLVIDTASLLAHESPLGGKLANGNFNYRHLALGLNVVGTGVRNCEEESQDCYSIGYIEYSLSHDGTNVGIVDWSGDTRYFNFGVGGISYGKALTAERYITMPLGTADLGLLSQQGIMKPEFRGRPLSGSYQLIVWDSPALDWEKIEDIQLVLSYRYWSRIGLK